jgi:ATP-dependent DNA ligase
MYRVPAGFIAPCLPTKAPQPPSGDLWLHEIKHDGFRMMIRRDAAGVRLLNAQRPRLDGPIATIFRETVTP